MASDLVIVFTPVGGGHKAAAHATAESARRRGLDVTVLDLFEYAPRIVGETYVGAHLRGQNLSPNLYGSVYDAVNYRDGRFNPVRRTWDNMVFARIAKEVRELRPRAVIATHHLPLVVLGRERRKGRLPVPLVGVVTDYTGHAVWTEVGVDAFAVPCHLAAEELAFHGVSGARIDVTGIPVRAAFERIPPVVSPSPGEPLRILVTSGGFGVGPLGAVVRSFAGVPDVALTIVCGAKASVYERMHEEAVLAGVNARIIGFEKDMAARVAEAHVVVGKSGGLTVTETLTAGRPMVVVGAVPGNEKMNERFVCEGGAGYAADPSDVASIVGAMRARGEIAIMGQRGRRLVLHDAAARVVSMTMGLVASRETRRTAA